MAPPAVNAVLALAEDAERFDAFREVLRRYCASLLGVDDAEDIVQAALERGLRSGPATGDAEGWLMTVARNLCIDSLRRRSLVASEELTDADLPLVDDHSHQVLARHSVATALHTLTPAERRAAHRAWLLDQTSPTAARSLGISDSSLRSLLERARRKLVVHLEEAERSIAGLLPPWLLELQHRLVRRRATQGGDDRWVAVAAPALALAVALASVVVLAPHPGTPARQGTAAGGGISGTGWRPAAPPAPERPPATLAFTAGQPGLLPSLPLSPGRPQDAYITDVQPSPDYASDHTVLAIGRDTNCQLEACSELFASRDAGRTWTRLPTTGLTGTQLLLPPASFASATFYAFGPGGLQITHNGSDFTTLVPDLPGYAGVLPPGQPGFVSVANVDLWSFANTSQPGLQGAYPAGLVATGSALAVRQGGVWTLLQPVQGPTGPELVIACSGTVCGTGAALPWNGSPTELVAGADGLTVLAFSARGAALSRDGGANFAALSLPAGEYVHDARITTSPAGTARLLLVLDSAQGRRASDVSYSDDLGRSWTTAGGVIADAVPGLVRIESGDALLLSLYQPANPNRLYGYECSSDGGARWGAC